MAEFEFFNSLVDSKGVSWNFYVCQEQGCLVIDTMLEDHKHLQPTSPLDPYQTYPQAFPPRGW